MSLLEEAIRANWLAIERSSRNSTVRRRTTAHSTRIYYAPVSTACRCRFERVRFAVNTIESLDSPTQFWHLSAVVDNFVERPPVNKAAMLFTTSNVERAELNVNKLSWLRQSG
jgi:hypothetical protein